MAFPTVIATDGLATVGIAGPFISSGGNVYTVIANDTQLGLRAMKASDPSSSFANAGTDPTLALFLRSLAGHQAGDVIHILTKTGDTAGVVAVHYHAFDMASDAWTTTNQTIVTAAAMDTPGWLAQVGITVRADGAIVACYNGSAENIATVLYDRVYYARNLAGTWTADFALGTAGVAASWVGGRAISGANNGVHFFFQDTTNSQIYQRTINSAYAMQAALTSFHTGVWGWEALENRGVYITASNIVSLPWFDESNQLSEAVLSSSDAPTVSINANLTNPILVLNAPIHYVASNAVDDTTLHHTFINTAGDIYDQTNANRAGWGAPTLFSDVSASAIYTNVYTRGNAKVLAMVYHSTDPTYNELTLSTTAATGGLPNGLMLGKCGR